MEIKRISAVGNHCNFCQRGKIENNYLVYPYTEVTLINGNKGGVTITVCDECLDTIKDMT